MIDFVKGRELSRRFFNEAALPILKEHFPRLEYSAGLLGYGSDVLGYDDIVSTDHMWGPRFYLFLKKEDMALEPELMSVFSRLLPSEFLSYNVNFSAPDLNDGGVRHATAGEVGSVSPLIFIYTLEDYLGWYLGYDFTGLDYADWLSFSENKLLSLKNAEFYVDDLRVKEQLEIFNFYPEDVKKYLLASNWSLISEEQAFVKRQLMTGDKLGAVLTASRITERLMRLCFIYCDSYAPYSKWFGRAFLELPIPASVISKISAIAENECDYETAIAEAQLAVAMLHDSKNITTPVNAEIQNYFGRDIKVIYSDRIANAIAERIESVELRALPLIGTMSQAANMVRFYDNPRYRSKIKSLYK